MELFSLLKVLAPGFIPLFAYLGAELIFGETVGLYVGIGIGALEFLYALVRERKVDFFALAETLLLAGMGALSLVSGNALFFRLKPAITEAVMVLSLSVLAFLPDPLVREYFGRQIRGIAIADGAIPELRKNLVLMTLVLAVHAGLTAWAAVAASPALWGFVSGGLLYLLLGLVFALRLLQTKRKTKNGVGRPPFPLARVPGPALGWSLLLFDEAGRIFAARQGGLPGGLWDNPLSGRAAGLPELEAGMGQGIARLGFGRGPQGGAGGQSPSPGGPQILGLRPLFLLDGRGTPSGGLGTTPFDPKVLFSKPEEASPDSIAVFAALAPAGSRPKGLDPTIARFWALSDLLALRGSDQIAPELIRLVDSLEALRASLREEIPTL